MKAVRRSVDILKTRLAGFSLLGVGANWVPPQSEREIVLRLFNFLENRRVLYVPVYLEVGNEVDISVIEIRHELTEILNELPENSRASNRVRHLRTAVRHFLEDAPPSYRNVGLDYLPQQSMRFRGLIDRELSPGYFVALGELRAIFGVQLSALAVEFEIDVEEDLASIFPIGE